MKIELDRVEPLDDFVIGTIKVFRGADSEFSGTRLNGHFCVKRKQSKEKRVGQYGKIGYQWIVGGDGGVGGWGRTKAAEV